MRLVLLKQDLIGGRKTVLLIMYIHGAITTAAGSGVLVQFYPVLVAYSAFWGGTIGSYLVVMPKVLAELVDQVNLASGRGLNELQCHTSKVIHRAD